MEIDIDLDSFGGFYTVHIWHVFHLEYQLLSNYLCNITCIFTKRKDKNTSDNVLYINTLELCNIWH